MPVQIENGQISPRNDLHNVIEEADVIMVHQMLQVAQAGASHINVVSDDTDIFILLLHHYDKHKLKANVTMESTSPGRSVIDIKGTIISTVQSCQNKSIISQLLAAHGLSGCDTTSSLHRIAKSRL